MFKKGLQTKRKKQTEKGTRFFLQKERSKETLRRHVKKRHTDITDI